MLSDHIVLIALWLGYFSLHSWLASQRIKALVNAKWPSSWPSYRLIYNAAAVILLLPPLWWMYSIDTSTVWQRNGLLRWVGDLVAVSAIGIFYWSLRFYDMKTFSGLTKTREGSGRLVISPLHRYVRHPWYFLALLIIWSRDMDSAFLLSASLMTVYFWAGSRLEERKLLSEFGPVYAEYIRRVPGLIPWPGKHLSQEQSSQLLEKYYL